MSFLRRLLGGSDTDRGRDGDDTDPGGTGPSSPSDAEVVAEEASREREVLRADAERLQDELLQRQLRYADRAWTPPAQGGERRADDRED